MCVHISSYRSVEDAKRGWAELRPANADLLSSLALDIAEIDLGLSQGIYYRVQAGPVGSFTTAQTLCAPLNSRALYCVPTI